MKAPREKAIKHSLRFPAKLPVDHDGLQKVSNGRERRSLASLLTVKMAAFLQWRRFVFFDKEPVKDPADGGKSFLLPAGISASDSGRGHVVLGDILLCANWLATS
ncbi:unnamed protein product [Merluccius merluccius]